MRPYLLRASEDPSRLVRFLARELRAEAGDRGVAVPGHHPAPPAAPQGWRDMGWLLFSFDGSIGRFTFWTMSFALSLVASAAGGIIVLGFGNFWITPLLAGLLAIPLSWANLALQVKRWHDRDKPGWWILIALVPAIGGLWALVENGLLPGPPGPNRYGERPV